MVLRKVRCVVASWGFSVVDFVDIWCLQRPEVSPGQSEEQVLCIMVWMKLLDVDGTPWGRTPGSVQLAVLHDLRHQN